MIDRFSYVLASISNELEIFCLFGCCRWERLIWVLKLSKSFSAVVKLFCQSDLDTFSELFSISFGFGACFSRIRFFFSSEFLKMQDGKRGVRGNKQKLGIIDGKGLKVYGETRRKLIIFLLIIYQWLPNNKIYSLIKELLNKYCIQFCIIWSHHKTKMEMTRKKKLHVLRCLSFMFIIWWLSNLIVFICIMFSTDAFWEKLKLAAGKKVCIFCAY